MNSGENRVSELARETQGQNGGEVMSHVAEGRLIKNTLI